MAVVCSNNTAIASKLHEQKTTQVNVELKTFRRLSWGSMSYAKFVYTKLLLENVQPKTLNEEWAKLNLLKHVNDMEKLRSEAEQEKIYQLYQIERCLCRAIPWDKSAFRVRAMAHVVSLRNKMKFRSTQDSQYALWNRSNTMHPVSTRSRSRRKSL